MTLLNIIQTADAHYIFTDSALIDGSGTFVGNVTKTVCVPAARCVVAISGPAPLYSHVPGIVAFADSIELIVEDLRVLLPKIVDMCRNECAPNRLYQISVAGFSHRGERQLWELHGDMQGETTVVRCDDDAWRFSPALSAFAIQAAQGVEAHNTFNAGIQQRLNARDPIGCGLIAAETQHNTPTLEKRLNCGRPTHIVGGTCQLTKVTFEAMEIKMLRCWNDVVGNPIKLFDLAGYKSSAGINSGSSSNYVVDTTNGNVGPSSTSSSISQATGTTIGNMTGGGGLAAGFDGTQHPAYTSAPQGPSGTSGYIGKNFTGSPKAISQAVAYSCSGVGSVHWADFENSATITLTLYGKSTAPSSGTDGTALGSVSFSNGPSGAGVATNQSATITSSDTTTQWNYVWVNQTSTNYVGGVQCMGELEFTGVSAANNMTVVTAFQTADSTVSNGRVLLEFDNTAASTLNTDLTVEITADGGAHWTTATLSAVTSNSQGGRKVAETNDQAIGTPGTSFATRIKTLNNKNIPIYGTTIQVH